jgi:hypothetical protein
MNPKPTRRSILISSSLVILLMVLYYYSAGAGHFVGKYLSLRFYNMVINVGGLTGVKWVLPSILYGVFTFLIGIAIVIVSFWRVFLKDTKTGLFAQFTPVNFVRYAPSYLAIGFFAGFTWVSADLIISMIYVIARLQR